MLEKDERFRSDQIVRRAYRRQESVGWEQLARGRAVRGLVEMQEDWNGRGESERGLREDARETVARAVAYALLFRYEVWKLRCKEVLKIELPAAEKAEYEAVERLREMRMDVGVGDRRLFEQRNVPKPGDALDHMKQWVRSVENAILRRRRDEKRSNRKVREFFPVVNT